METGQFFELAVGGDVESRRMLSFWGPKSLGNRITVIYTSMDQERLLSSFGRSQVVWHRLGGARGRDMLYGDYD